MGEEFQRSVEEFVAKLNRVLDLSINAAGRFDAEQHHRCLGA